MPNKLTDADVKKALPKVLYGGHGCKNCKYDNGKGDDRCGLKGCKIARNDLSSSKAEVERAQEAIKILRVSAEQAHFVRKDGKSPLSLLTAEIKAEAYKEFAERSEKEIFIKQDDERKQMLEILKTYRGTRNYSDTEQATDNWLRGYGEAVQDILGVFDNLLNELAGDTSAGKNK